MVLSAPSLYRRRLHEVRCPRGQSDEPQHPAYPLSSVRRRPPASRTSDEYVELSAAAEPSAGATTEPTERNRPRHKTVTELLASADRDLTDLYEAVKAYLIALGDDVQLKTLDNYIAFRRLKNFACVEVKPQIRHIKVFLKIDPDTVALEPGFTRDVRNVGHFGTGDLEILITSTSDLEKAKPLLDRSYEAS